MYVANLLKSITTIKSVRGVYAFALPASSSLMRHVRQMTRRRRRCLSPSPSLSHSLYPSAFLSIAAFLSSFCQCCVCCQLSSAMAVDAGTGSATIVDAAAAAAAATAAIFFLAAGTQNFLHIVVGMSLLAWTWATSLLELIVYRAGEGEWADGLGGAGCVRRQARRQFRSVPFFYCCQGGSTQYTYTC